MAAKDTIQRTKAMRDLQNPLTFETVVFGALLLYSAVV